MMEMVWVKRRLREGFPIDATGLGEFGRVTKS
jgi:hypothetical protein